jgi:hypothetical protein
MDGRPNREFGKRGPIAPQSPAPRKRSGHVALLLMGTVAVGGGAYALMPGGGGCQPTSPGMAAPAVSQAATGCGPRSSSSGGGHGGSWSSRSNFFSGDNGSGHTASGSTSDSGSGVTRGGFGSFARAFAAHFSGS